jgi:hypothetical protein
MSQRMVPHKGLPEDEVKAPKILCHREALSPKDFRG